MLGYIRWGSNHTRIIAWNRCPSLKKISEEVHTNGFISVLMTLCPEYETADTLTEYWNLTYTKSSLTAGGRFWLTIEGTL